MYLHIECIKEYYLSYLFSSIKNLYLVGFISLSPTHIIQASNEESTPQTKLTIQKIEFTSFNMLSFMKKYSSNEQWQILFTQRICLSNSIMLDISPHEGVHSLTHIKPFNNSLVNNVRLLTSQGLSLRLTQQYIQWKVWWWQQQQRQHGMCVTLQ